MRILYKSMLLFLFMFFTANAVQEPNIADSSVLDKTKVSIYLHPVMLLLGANVAAPLFYSTIEIPTSLYNAPIIKPSFWFISDSDILRVGSDFGLRHYPSGSGEGLYLQPSIGLFYFSAYDSFSFDLSNDTKYEERKKNGTWLDVMGYLGYASKFDYLSIYSDIGIGYACLFSKCTIMFDTNIGIGMSF